MDSGMVMVLFLLLGSAIFLVYAERNSRRNEARRRVESAATKGLDQPDDRPVAAKLEQKASRKKSS